MNLTTISRNNRSFVTELLSKGISKGELVSVSLGVAISNSNTVPNDIDNLIDISKAPKRHFDDQLTTALNFILAVIPLNVRAVQTHALNHFKTRALICNSAPRHIAYNEKHPHIAAFSLNAFMSNKELELVTTREGIELVNGFMDLLTEMK